MYMNMHRKIFTEVWKTDGEKLRFANTDTKVLGSMRYVMRNKGLLTNSKMSVHKFMLLPTVAWMWNLGTSGET